MDFWKACLKILKNEGQHEKIFWKSEVPKFFRNSLPTLKFLPLSSLTIQSTFLLIELGLILLKDINSQI